MIKPVSGACNMRCTYCFYADEMAHREGGSYGCMTLDTLETAVRRVLRAAEGEAHFVFQGGEPTLAGLPFFEALIRFERRYAPQGLRVFNAVQTNGLELSDELIALFARERFLVGVSIDGTQAIHDQRRVDRAGDGTYARVERSLERLSQAHVDFNVLCVVDGEVARHPQEVYRALAPYRWLQFIPCLDPLDGRPGEFALTADEYAAFLIQTFDLYEQSQQTGHPVSIRSFDNWVGMLLGHPPESCALSGVCGRSLMMESDGRVYPCDFYGLDEWCLGNIREEPFRRMLTCSKEAQFVEASLPVPKMCRACRWYPLCRNGCRRERVSRDGEWITRWCSAHRAFFEYAYPKLVKVAERIERRQAGTTG